MKLVKTVALLAGFSVICLRAGAALFEVIWAGLCVFAAGVGREGEDRVLLQESSVDRQKMLADFPFHLWTVNWFMRLSPPGSSLVVWPQGKV